MGEKILRYKLNRRVNLIKGYLKELQHILFGDKLFSKYHGIEACANNYTVTFKTAKGLLESGRNLEDCVELLKMISYDSLIEIHDRVKHYCNKIYHEDKKELALADKFEELLKHNNVVYNHDIISQIKEVIEHIKNYVVEIRKFNFEFSRVIDSIRRQEQDIKRYSIGKNSKEFVIRHYQESQEIYKKFLVIEKEFKKRLGYIEDEDILNKELITKLDGLIEN